MVKAKHSKEALDKDQERKVALIGSSGGGTATLGHCQTQTLLSQINRELAKIGRRR